MQLATYETNFKNEDTYWWFSARREIVLHLRQKYAVAKNPLMLNIGCGTGGFSLDLKDHGEVISFDYEKEALNFCSKNKLHNLLQSNAEKIPLRENRCDEIYALDILEHLDDDAAGAKEIYRCLKPRTGFAIVTVPAYPLLWSKIDNVSHHRRRYKYKNLCKLFTQAGFTITLLRYYNFFLFPLALLIKLKERRTVFQEDQDYLPSLPSILNLLFKKIFASEKHFIPYLYFPFGVSLIAVLKKT